MYINIPSIYSDKHELADVIEWHALEHPTHCSSVASLRSVFSAPDDELNVNGVEESDDRVMSTLQEAQQECSVRRSVIQNSYPFVIDNDACYLSIEGETGKPAKWVYLFLLMATRMNMQTERVLGGIDATKIFERICSLVAREYLGIHSKSLVFGTAQGGGFREKFTNLLREFHIDGSFQPPFGWTGSTKDAGVDVVAWIPFADQKDSQLIALGQCKTGTSWQTNLRKSPLFAEFSTRQPMIDPVDIYFFAEALGVYKWEDNSRRGGMLFDRIRIIEYLPNNIEEEILTDMKKWLNAAFVKTGIDIRWE